MQTAAGVPVHAHDELASTNAEAMRLGLAGGAAPLWVTAARQTAGRGRSGRHWHSEPGNLYASLMVRLACTPAVLHHLSFVAAVATLAAIRRAADGAGLTLPLRLKWPNDVLIDGAKLTGILPESTIIGNGSALAVIGIGVNLAHAPQGLGRATSCLSDHGLATSPRDMLELLDQELARSLAEWREGAGFAAIRARWLADALPPGTAMSIKAGEKTISGVFRDLAEDGALILRDHSGYDRAVTYGDVTLEAASAAEVS